MIRIPNRPRQRADIAIDLGTANTLVVERGSGIVFDQPSICCFKGFDAIPEFVAAGAEALTYVGRTPKPLRIVRPLRNGVLSDIGAARELIRYATRTLRPAWRLARTRALIGLPADATQAERRALATAAVDAGLAEPELVAEPLMSAIGAGLAVDEPRGRMVVDCGAGTTEVIIISLGQICFNHSVRGGGEALDRMLIDHLHQRHRFQIGSSTAEQLKLELSSLLARGAASALLEVRGLDVTQGIPRTITVPACELLAVWDRYSQEILGAVRTALAETPPELCRDILEDGITLTGGAAMTGLLASLISDRTGVETRVSEAPLKAVADGLGALLNDSR
jgi:rod shape-determining protein MreB